MPNIHYVAIPTDNDYSVPCIVCGENVKLNKTEAFAATIGGMSYVKVCQRCKDAIAWAAKEMPLIPGREYNKK